MLFLFRSAPEVEKRIHSKLFRKFWRSRGTKEPAYITVLKLAVEMLKEDPQTFSRQEAGSAVWFQQAQPPFDGIGQKSKL